MYGFRTLLTPGRAVTGLLFVATVLFTSVAMAGSALVLNGNDNTLASVDLARDQVETNLFTFSGFPNQVVVAMGNVYVVASGSDEIYVLSRKTLKPRHIISTGAGTNPYSVAVDPQGNMYVSLFLTGEVVRYNSNGEETGRASVGRSPEGVLLLGDRLYVANTGFRFSDFGYDPGSVSVLDAGSLETLSEIPVGMNPQWVRHTGSELHVLCTGNFFSVFSEVHIVDQETHATESVLALGGSPGYLALGNDRGFTADYFGGIYSYQVSTREILHGAGNPIAFGGTGYSGIVVEDKSHLLVTLFGDDLVARVDVETGEPTSLFSTGDGPVNVAMRTGNANRQTHGPVNPEPRMGETERGQPTELGLPGRTALPLSIRPLQNPVRGNLALALENTAPGSVRLAMFNASGRLVRRDVRDAAPTANLDTSTLPAGIYFVKVFQDGQSASTKVVIAR